jgi:type VI secretion system protein ImpE
MPTAKELFDQGQLRAAIDAVTAEVKANPADLQPRTFLFELLCFAGDWDRAEKQIDVVSQQSLESAIGVQVYRDNIRAERERKRLFSEGVHPHFLTEPPPYVDIQLEAVKALGAGDAAATRQLLDQAEELRPALPGKWNDEVFSDFRDYNDLTGPVLELIVKDKYAWLPFEQIRQLEIDPPRKLRDLVWVPARIRATDHTTGEVFIPALYAGSSEHESDQVKLGRVTEWKAVREDLYVGAGLRLFLVDETDRSLLETRKLELGPQEGVAGGTS